MNKYVIAGLLAVSFSLGILLTAIVAKEEFKEERTKGYQEGRTDALRDVISGACATWEAGPVSDCMTKFQIVVGNLEEKGLLKGR